MKVRTVAPTHIIIHHSLTADGPTVSWGAIEDYHRYTNKWDDIGYHAGVETVNWRAYALVGRGLQYEAAAVKESKMNSLGLHVCVVGNFDTTEPSPAVLEVLAKRIVRPWMERFNIPAHRVMGHRDFASYKSCPGTKFDLVKFRETYLKG